MSETDVTNTEARWRNYQKLIWTQQQIQLQIHKQQQQQQSVQQYQSQKMNGLDNGHQQQQDPTVPQQQQQQQGHHPSTQGIQGEMPEAPMEEPPAKDTIDPWENFDAQTAFLGPTLWDKRVPYDGQDFKEYVDLEEFLTENGIPMDPNGANAGHNLTVRNLHRDINTGAPHHNIGGGIPPQMINSTVCMPPIPPVSAETQQMMAGPSRINHHGGQNPMRPSMGRRSRSPSPSGSASSGISHDMSSDTSPDSSQTGEMGLGSIPGHDFDPRTRSFTEDELKPQPMIKKSRKQVNTFVPNEAKDSKYWARRRKNNMAAKRSRDARRVKENQIAMRACYLEKENQALKLEMDRVAKENQALKLEMDRLRKVLG
ncbi:hepatic leukemia factor isoform X2 [Folsomia candida]|uniref:hepatic leukemia factor isoform X2 n=1 Tax=Folsomia candida TaxID=158441 RepID=UPI000B8FCCA9|nr:hepatic leukemia factor isoform X2 [Folsomia candida]